jgi:hypothetical protein
MGRYCPARKRRQSRFYRKAGVPGDYRVSLQNSRTEV